MGLAEHSPTKYGRLPDEWHNNKDHEAVAEGFTHLVLGQPVSPDLEQAVRDMVRARVESYGGAQQ